MIKRKAHTPTKVALPLACTVALGVPIATSPTAVAQDASAPTEPTKMEKVIVTGSNIPTAETVDIAPVEVYTAEKIDRSGAGAIEVMTKKMPIAVGGGNFGMSRGNGGGGTSEISLRGIPGGTLLLINGRRTANQDLNAIPVAAIDKIEILKDGGSSLYGSDAIAGVVNIILKKDFTGAEFDARYGNTIEKDSGEQRYSFITGFADENTSLMVGGSYYLANALYSGDRDRSRPDRTDPRQTSPTSMPGRVRTTDAGGLAAFPALAGGLVYRGAAGTTGTSPADYTSFSNTTDRFPYGFFTPAIRDAERYSFFGNGERKLFGDNLKFFSESYYTHSYNYNQLAPVPIVYNYTYTPSSPNGIVIPADHPYNVFGVPIDLMRYRPVELGPRTDSNTFDIFRFVGGLKGRIADTSWNWETAVLYTVQDGVNLQGNDLSRMGLEQATVGPWTGLGAKDPATAFNPFGNGANSAAVLNAIRLDHYTFTRDKLFMIDAKVNGEVVNLPAGPLAIAVGGEHRQERGDYLPDGTLIYDDVVGFNASKPFSGSRDVNAGFYELKIPVCGGDMKPPALYRLEIGHSGRFEDYSDFGSTYNPKIGIRWNPIDDSLLFRASYSESYTAPGFGDLYLAAQESYPELRNPVKYFRGDPTYFDQIRTFYSGNPNLDPATAKNYSAGVVWSPKFVKGLTVALDWWRVNQKDVPGSVDQYILDQNYQSAVALNPAAPNPNDPRATFSNLVRYNPATSEYDTLYAPTQNLSRRNLEGLDASVTYELDTETAGKFTLSVLASYYLKFEQENIPGEGLRDRLGDFVDPSQSFGLGSLPRIKGNASVIWDYKNLEVGITANYIGAYNDDVYSGFDREIEAWLTFDAQISYKLLHDPKAKQPRDLKISVGILNFTDEAPPRVFGAFADNYDRDTHDLRGAFWYASVSKKF